MENDSPKTKKEPRSGSIIVATGVNPWKKIQPKPKKNHGVVQFNSSGLRVKHGMTNAKIHWIPAFAGMTNAKTPLSPLKKGKMHWNTAFVGLNG